MLGMLRRRRGAGSPLRIRADLVADMLTLIKVGWANSVGHPDVSRETCEIKLNARLGQGMRKAVNDRVVRSAKRISVLPGTESGPDGQIREGITDISIHLRDLREGYNRHGPHAVIECKRIEGTDTDLCRLYVVQGVDRFRSGKYGRGYAVGFMVGYLVSGSADEATTGVNKYLAGKERDSERLARSTVNGEDWESRHPRSTTDGDISLYHVMLAFAVGTSAIP